MIVESFRQSLETNKSSVLNSILSKRSGRNEERKGAHFRYFKSDNLRKFDPLFNLEEDGPRELGIAPAGGYKIRSNRLPLLPYNEEMALVRNEHMLLKYDLERRTF